MTRTIVFEQNAANPTQFKYSAQTNPSPLVTTPATAPQTPDNSLEILITVPAGTDYTVKSITFTATDLMQNADNLSLSVYDPNDNDWSFTNDGMTFTLAPSSGFTLSNTEIAAEIAGFVTPADAGAAKVTINEVLVGLPAGGGALTVGIFPLGFFFDGLGAWFQPDKESVYIPVAEVSNGAVVQLQWDSSAIKSQISIYQSGVAEPATPEDVGYWSSPALTEDTVFTVAATQDGVTLTQSVAVTVSSPDIPARSLTASGAVTGGSITTAGGLSAGSITTAGALSSGPITASSATINGPLTIVNGLGTAQVLALPDADETNYYTATADGFIVGMFEGYSVPGGTTAPVYAMIQTDAFTISATAGMLTPGATLVTFGNCCVPVHAGEPFSIFIHAPNGVPDSSALYANVQYLPFGTGTASPATGAVKPKAAQRTRRPAVMNASTP